MMRGEIESEVLVELGQDSETDVELDCADMLTFEDCA